MCVCVADGSYSGSGAGQGLLGQSRRRRQQNRNAAKNTAGSGEFDRIFGGVAAKTEAGAVRMGKSVPQMRQALAVAATEAGSSCERTTDEAKLGMLTREYIAADNLQYQLARTIKALHEERPGRDELQTFLLASLKGQEYTLKGPAESDPESSHVSDYLARNGGFALLKPALFAVRTYKYTHTHTHTHTHARTHAHTHAHDAHARACIPTSLMSVLGTGGEASAERRGRVHRDFHRHCDRADDLKPNMNVHRRLAGVLWGGIQGRPSQWPAVPADQVSSSPTVLWAVPPGG